MGIRTRIFFITLSCLFVGISLSFIVAERDLSIKLQAQIETELSRQAKILRKSISGLIDSGDLVALKSEADEYASCLLYTSPSPRDATLSRMPSSA